MTESGGGRIIEILSRGSMNPGGRLYRYLVMIVVASIPLGSYFAYDSVGAMEETLMTALGVGKDSIGMLYSVYSVAAIFTVFIGGLLVDYLGTRMAIALFAGVATVGAAIVAGASDITGMYAGRLLFGAGAESMIVAQSAIFTRWFKGKELALSFGVGLTMCRLGTIFSFNTEAMLAHQFGHSIALWVAAGSCALGFLASMIYFVMDARAEAAIGLQKPSADRIAFRDVKAFPASFWYVTILCVVFYSAIFPFTGLAPDFFHTKWGMPNVVATEGSLLYQVTYNFLHIFTTAPGLTSVVILASMLFAPFAGSWVDRFGRRATLMIFGSLLLVPVYLTFGLTHLPPIIPMVALGAAFVLVPAAMWPSVSLIIEERRVGTAFGVMTMLQNGGLALFSYLNGRLREQTGDYTASMMMFACLGIVGAVFAVLMLRWDAAHGRVLERHRHATASSL